MKNLPEFLIAAGGCSDVAEKIRNSAEDYRPLLASWLLELALILGWYKIESLQRRSLFENESFLTVTGLKIEIKASKSGSDGQLISVNKNRAVKLTNAAAERILKSHLKSFANQPLHDSLYLFKNIKALGDLIQLNNTEQAILCFVVLLDVFRDFKDALSGIRHKATLRDVGFIISHLAGQNEADVHKALRRDSTLIATGIIEVCDSNDEFEDKLDLLRGLGMLLSQPHENEAALIDRFMKKTSAPVLSTENFPHLKQDAHTLKSYLEGALQKGEPGTNILLYGIPGTGKTEFVKALAAEMSADLYEISFSDEDGDAITGTARLGAYNLCQRMLSKKDNALLMFDEIEDVFPSQGGWRALFGIEAEEGDEKTGKAWVNRTLELNATPAIWITNNANIDPAYLRRFDYSIRFPVPPQKVRMEIARYHLGQFNPPISWLAQIAANEQMTPAQYERAAKVARISSSGDDEQARVLVDQALDRSASLLGQKRMPTRNTLHTGYDLRFVNTSMAMADIIAGLKKKKQGTFCFYGPAGTGKSELARYIADELGMPCIVRRASDILSMWVGEAEKNIAAMFAEARQQDAVLVLDEADSFLADRRDAQRSWEVTQVNELLTQMEAFTGIFVCTTNLMEKLDQASLRRFAFKVKFDYLTAEQRWAMFLQEYKRLGGNEPDANNWEKQLINLDKLTPGDFAVAARQYNIMDMPVTAEGLYHQLLEECRMKGGATGKIGFIA